jgi:hypothetical protein
MRLAQRTLHGRHADLELRGAIHPRYRACQIRSLG